VLIDEAGAKKIAERIAAIERETDAELVTVLARRSDDYGFIPTLWAALAALLTPWLLELAPLADSYWLEARHGLVAQGAVFVALAVLLRWAPIQRRVVPRSVQVWRASSLARRQFLEQGLHHTRGATGVLVFVSEAEHYVEILADRGIDAHVGHEGWQKIVDAFTAHIREGRVLDGFLECIDACGMLLVEHVPASEEKNELPNHLVLL
jgi:putative membrane protein